VIAPHIVGIHVHPQRCEERVVGFFDRTLLACEA
jgi:hypothetical protein